MKAEGGLSLGAARKLVSITMMFGVWRCSGGGRQGIGNTKKHKHRCSKKFNGLGGKKHVLYFLGREGGRHFSLVKGKKKEGQWLQETTSECVHGVSWADSTRNIQNYRRVLKKIARKG